MFINNTLNKQKEEALRMKKQRVLNVIKEMEKNNLSQMVVTSPS